MNLRYRSLNLKLILFFLFTIITSTALLSCNDETSSESDCRENVIEEVNLNLLGCDIEFSIMLSTDSDETDPDINNAFIKIYSDTQLEEGQFFNLAIDLNKDGEYEGYLTEEGFQEEWIEINTLTQEIPEDYIFEFTILDPEIIKKYIELNNPSEFITAEEYLIIIAVVSEAVLKIKQIIDNPTHPPINFYLLEKIKAIISFINNES